MLSPIQNLQRRTPLGWLQLTRQKGRFLVALSGIAFADILMFMQLGFQAALFDSNTRLHRSMEADIFLISPQARNLANMSTFTRRRLFQANDVPGVKSAEPMHVNFIDWKNPETGKKSTLLIMGFNPDKSAVDLPEVNQQLNKVKLADSVLFDRAGRGDYAEVIKKVDQGKKVNAEIERRTVHVSGLFKVGASFIADATLITSDQNFLRLFPRREVGSISIGLVKLKPESDPQKVAAQLKTHLGNDVRVLTKEEFITFEKDYWQKSTSIGFIFNLGVMMGFMVGVIIVYQVLSTDVNAHMKEYATFKAMGFRNSYLLSVVFEEAIILAILGFIPGISVSLALYTMTSNATNLPVIMTFARAIQVMIMTVIMCMISGAVATRKVQSADPADMF
ncbi:DevC protein [Calothrix sp. NIES-4101]|nr:DevC protein [Calothrix sp. NIES-4101]